MTEVEVTFLGLVPKRMHGWLEFPWVDSMVNTKETDIKVSGDEAWIILRSNNTLHILADWQEILEGSIGRVLR